MPRIEGADGELRAVEAFGSAAGVGRRRAASEAQETDQNGETAAPRNRNSILRRDLGDFHAP